MTDRIPGQRLNSGAHVINRLSELDDASALGVSFVY